MLRFLSVAAIAILAMPRAHAQVSEVKTWQVTSSIEVSRTAAGSEVNEDLLVKASAVILVASSLPAGSHFQWMSPDPRVPGSPGIAPGKGTVDVMYKERRANTGASSPGGARQCVFTGEVSYSGMIMAMPGQGNPVGSAKPQLPRTLSCQASGDLAGETEYILEIPLECAAPPTLTYANGRLTGGSTCEVDGHKVTTRFAAEPARNQ